MLWIFSLASFCVVSYAATDNLKCVAKARLAFAIDLSGSTVGYRKEYFKFFDRAIDYISSASNKSSEQGGDMDLAIVLFGLCVPQSSGKKDCSHHASHIVPSNFQDAMTMRTFGLNQVTTLDSEKQNFRKTYMKYNNGFTPIGPGLLLAHELLKEQVSDGKIKPNRTAVILLTDGEPSALDLETGLFDTVTPLREAKEGAVTVKKFGSTLYSIYIGSSGALPELMQEMASPNKSFAVSTFSDLAAFDKAFRTILLDVCSHASIRPPVVTAATLAPIPARENEQDRSSTPGWAVGLIIAVVVVAMLTAVSGIAFLRYKKANTVKVGPAAPMKDKGLGHFVLRSRTLLPDLLMLILTLHISEIVEQGWLPIFDSLHGIRGELNLVVALEIFANASRQKNSSCEVSFFSSMCVPDGYQMSEMYGLVEELVVDVDPEHKWIDKIRTARASNDARQTLFSKLAGQVTRKMGVKVLELGGNTVLGYRQSLDLEGSSGLVIRGIGTAVLLTKVMETAPVSSGPLAVPEVDDKQSSPPLDPIIEANSSHADGEIELVRRSVSAVEQPEARDVLSPSKEPSVAFDLRSTDPSRQTSVAPEPLTVPLLARCVAPMGSFITLTDLPPGHVLGLGGVVCAKSVKLIDKGEQEGHLLQRDEWWQELRNEISSHMRALQCDAVLGYRETTTIHNDVCVLQASGTAVLLGSSYGQMSPFRSPLSTRSRLSVDTNLANGYHDLAGGERASIIGCHPAHIPYTPGSLPFPTTLHRCKLCGEGLVPDLLLCTVDPPAELTLQGYDGEEGVMPRLIQARIVRKKADQDGEALAKSISDQLPFVEHDLHSFLVSKMKTLGYNAIFGLKMDLSVSDRFLVALATGTGIVLPGIPAPAPPCLLSMNVPELASGFGLGAGRKATSVSLSPSGDGARRDSFGKLLSNLPPMRKVTAEGTSPTHGGHLVMQLEKLHESELHSVIGSLPPSITVVNASPSVIARAMGAPAAGLATRPLHMVARLYMEELTLETFDSNSLTKLIERMIKTTIFKYRRMLPVCLTNVNFGIMVPEEDEIQVSFSALVLVNSDAPSDVFACQNQASEARGSALRTRHTSVQPGDASGSETSLDTLETSTRFTSDLASVRLSISSQPGHIKKRLFRRISGSSRDDVTGPFVAPTSEVVASFESRVKPQSVLVSPLPTTQAYPCHTVIAYLGYYDFFFIRETSSLREEGGLSTFVQLVISEVVYTVQAHVVALGGNGILSFALSSNELLHTANHAQCIVHVSGDIVLMSTQ